MSNKLSDVTVNISVEDVIRSAEFGAPLLYLPPSSYFSTVPYTECYGMEGIKKIMVKYGSYNVSEVKSVSKSFVSGENLPSTVDGEDSIFRVSGDNWSMSDNSAHECDGMNYSMKLTGLKDLSNIIEFNSGTDGIPMLRIICGCGSGRTGRLYLAKDSEKNFVDYADIDDGTNCVIFELEKYSKYFIVAQGDTSIYIYNLRFVDGGMTLFKAAEAFFRQDNAPEKVGVYCGSSTDLYSIRDENWRQMIVVSERNYSFEELVDLSNIIELWKKPKLLYGVCKDNSSVTRIKDNERTVLLYPTNEGKYTDTLFGPALVGATCTKPVGSITYKNVELKGVTPVDITKETLDALHEKNINAFVTKAGRCVTSEGKTASGEYIDIVDAKDWLVLQIQYQLQQVLINNDKVPYDNNGIAMLETAVINILKDAHANGMIATNEDGTGAYSVNFAKRKETKKEDRAERRYVEGKFSFDLAGAIHTVTINGEILI